MKLNKPQNVAKVVIKKIVPFVVPKVAITTIAIDNHVVIIQVQIGKSTIEDILLNGGFGVNIIIEQLKLKLGLPKPKPAPYNLRMTY
jgi:hypothetical protein